MHSRITSMKMGPLSIFTLIIILCLATLVVLCVSSAKASLKMAENQAKATSDTYELERAGQKLLALVDNKKSDDEIMSTFSVDYPQLKIEKGTSSKRDNADNSSESESNLTQLNYSVSKLDRKLIIVANIKEDQSIEILEWKFITVLTEKEPAEKLWAGL